MSTVRVPARVVDRSTSRSAKRAFGIGLIVCAGIAAWAVLAPGRQQILSTVYGVVVATQARDRLDESSSAALAINENGQTVYYEIVADSKGRQLSALDGKRVRVEGTLGEDEDGRRWLKARAWHTEMSP